MSELGISSAVTWNQSIWKKHRCWGGCPSGQDGNQNMKRLGFGKGVQGTWNISSVRTNPLSLAGLVLDVRTFIQLVSLWRACAMCKKPSSPFKICKLRPKPFLVFVFMHIFKKGSCVYRKDKIQVLLAFPHVKFKWETSACHSWLEAGKCLYILKDGKPWNKLDKRNIEIWEGRGG